MTRQNSIITKRVMHQKRNTLAIHAINLWLIKEALLDTWNTTLEWIIELIRYKNSWTMHYSNKIWSDNTWDHLTETPHERNPWRRKYFLPLFTLQEDFHNQAEVSWAQSNVPWEGYLKESNYKHQFPLIICQFMICRPSQKRFYNSCINTLILKTYFMYKCIAI